MGWLPECFLLLHIYNPMLLAIGLMLISCLAYSSTQNMEAVYSFETPVVFQWTAQQEVKLFTNIHGFFLKENYVQKNKCQLPDWSSEQLLFLCQCILMKVWSVKVSCTCWPGFSFEKFSECNFTFKYKFVYSLYIKFNFYSIYSSYFSLLNSWPCCWHLIGTQSDKQQRLTYKNE
jgi:hypothetical protein